MINALAGVLLLGTSQLAPFVAAHKSEVPVAESITIAPAFDAFVQVGFTAVSTSEDQELRLGTFDGTTVARSFLNWEVPEIEPARVKRALLRLHAIHSWSCRPVQWEVWTTETATDKTRWTDQPQWRERHSETKLTSGYSDNCPDGPVVVEITELVRDWLATGTKTGTIGLRATDETDQFSWKKFASADGDNPPRISIDLFEVSGT